jgi:hypothetical protein
MACWEEAQSECIEVGEFSVGWLRRCVENWSLRLTTGVWNFLLMFPAKYPRASVALLGNFS